MPDLKKDVLRDFQIIPGIGPNISEDFWDMGYRSKSELRNEDPEEMYDRLCVIRGAKVDRCVLYVFRCAVYFTSNPEHDPNLLKWWNWKDKQ